MKPIPPNITPGPWRESHATVNAVSHGRWFKVAKADCRQITEAGNYANARAIAALPDLLAALETIHANAAESAEWIRRHTRAALEKAGYTFAD